MESFITSLQKQSLKYGDQRTNLVSLPHGRKDRMKGCDGLVFVTVENGDGFKNKMLQCTVIYHSQ